MKDFLWGFTWWRVLVVLLVSYGPVWLRDWLSYHSGLSEGLERLFREHGDLDLVQETRAVRRQLEERYGPSS